ncbi:MAG: tetratricopeptide repeat protein, partial [Gemmatimonadota bacterium]
AEAEAVLQERPADFVARMVYGRLLLEAGRTREAAEHFEEAVSLFPDYAGPEHPLRYLAQIDAQAGRPAQAAARLSALAALNESDLAANMELAQLSTAVGDSVGALAALGRTLWIYPFDADVHRKIAEIGMPLLDRTAAIRARESVVALDPPDRALALYELALTQFQLGGRHVSARANVLQALEIAPSYSDALDLLLRIRESEAEWRERRGEAVEDS